MFSRLIPFVIRPLGRSFAMPKRSFLQMPYRIPPRPYVALGLGLGLSIGVGSVLCQDVDLTTVRWRRWDQRALNRKELIQLHIWTECLSPSKRDIILNVKTLTGNFRGYCDKGNEKMSMTQFFRWLEFYTNQDFNNKQRSIWTRAFDLDSTGLVSLNEFVSVYMLVSTMEKKRLKKRDLLRWTNANFAAMDLDNSGFLDFDEVVLWIEFAIRAGYISNRNKEAKTFMTAEELADCTLRKYDDNFDGQISKDEFKRMFNDLLDGHFTDWSPLSADPRKITPTILKEAA